ncbi:MAG: hypothetical protein QOK59_01225 [Nitrososphaeraceae archaeon]|nr:hypothetical protein [Nitrososphaeraceae archaeon]MDW0147285.1 hypothetical protein [Nitrososphaeraceae archaeon]MDW0158418.1 hypothetical protein [Nitrososphaeraceae archaeon]
MSFIRVVGSKQFTRIAALDEMSLLIPCRKNVPWHRHEELIALDS